MKRDAAAGFALYNMAGVISEPLNGDDLITAPAPAHNAHGPVMPPKTWNAKRELLVTGQFLRRRVRAGAPWLRVLFLGDTDERAVAGGPGTVAVEDVDDRDEFDGPPSAVLRRMLVGGVSLPWSLAVAGLIGLSLLFTRVTLGAEGGMADAHHIIGCLVLTVVAIAAADVARPARALNAVLGVGLMLVPFVFAGDPWLVAVSIGLGLALVVLSVRRGPIHARYGAWSRWLV